MGPTESKQNEKKKRALKLIQVIKTDQATKYVRPLFSYSIHYQPKQAYRRNGNFVALTNIRTKTIKPVTIYLGVISRKKNVIDLSFPLHPTPCERIVISVSLPLTLKSPFDSRGKDNYVPPLP